MSGSVNPQVVRLLTTKMYQTIDVLVARSGLCKSTVRYTLTRLNYYSKLDTIAVKVDLVDKYKKAYRLAHG